MNLPITSLSVFFPCVNEEENIKKTIDQAVIVLNNLSLEYEIVIVDDGSTDTTTQIADQIAKTNSKIRVIHHEKNLGYGSALKTGFKTAKYPWVAFADSDGQFDFSEIKFFLEKSDKADLILGYRLKRADSILRKIYTFGWQMLARVLLGMDTKDYSCGFKMIKKKVFEAVQPLEGEEKVTQIELLVKAKRLGFKAIDVGVHHFPRIYGKPTGAKLEVVIKSVIDIFKLWWKLNDHKLVFILLLAILFLAAFLRFYRLDEYMTFLGDEGRDALVVRRLLVEGDIPFIGPPTSVGNMYLGPLYYYMMAIPMSIFFLNPVGAASMVALLGVLTVLLVYYIGQKWFGFISGLTAAFLYSISPITIIYSKSSWNPNPAPFFALLAIIGFFKAHQSRNFNWLILTGISLGFIIQMHYLALILIPIYFILWLYELFLKTVKRVKSNNFILGTILSITVFVILMIPLVLFDMKHDFMNFRAVTTFFTERESTVNLNPLNTAERIIPIYKDDLISRYVTGQNEWVGLLVSVLIFIPILFIVVKRRTLTAGTYWQFFALGLWLVVGVLGLALYKHSIFDHYLGFISPVPFLLLGSVIIFVPRKWQTTIAILIVVILGYVNLQKNPLLAPPNGQLERTQKIVKFIIGKTENKPFNFALIAKSNYDAAYQYYFDVYGHPSLQVPFDITDQLFVVCEDEVCQPEYNSKYEIAGFGWSKIERQYDTISGIKIYKLIHNPAEKQ